MPTSVSLAYFTGLLVYNRLTFVSKN